MDGFWGILDGCLVGFWLVGLRRNEVHVYGACCGTGRDLVKEPRASGTRRWLMRHGKWLVAVFFVLFFWFPFGGKRRGG